MVDFDPKDTEREIKDEDAERDAEENPVEADASEDDETPVIFTDWAAL